MKEFPIPVVALGPGTQPVEAGPECLNMPTDMDVFRQPRLLIESDPELSRDVCVLLDELVQAMRSQGYSAGPAVRLNLLGREAVSLDGFSDALGEGEVSIVLQHDDGQTRIQETAFAGVWRVQRHDGAGAIVEDAVEACAIPPRVIAAARSAAVGELNVPPVPEGAMNSPAVLTELIAASGKSDGEVPAHVVNLTLLPLTPVDVQYLGEALGPGSARLLSRGYGKCRITSTALHDTWWVQYFNGMDKLILNTLEVVAIPEVALAAPEDWADSLERIEDLIGVLSES